MADLDYRPERTILTNEQHELAREFTEAVNAYVNETKGDELRESLDVGIAVAKMLIGQADRKKALENLAMAGFGAAMNAVKAKAFEDQV